MTTMQSLTTSLGSLLIILGVASFYGTGMSSMTALIPAFFGVFFVIFGLFARKDVFHDRMIKAAMGIAILGVLGTASGILKLFSIFAGGDVARPMAVYGQSAMFLMCTMYTISGARFFKKKNQTED